MNRLKRSRRESHRLLTEAASNISPSKYLAQLVAEQSYTVEYIPNFIDLPRYQFGHRAIPGPRLFWVRAFHKIYHPEMAVEVLHNLKEIYPHATLCMVGADTDGTLASVQQKISKYNLMNDVIITGRLLKAEWTALSAEYDIFINTTHIDNMPVSVIEAMALGFPIVSTRVGGIPYLLKHEETALLTYDADAVGMTACIVRLLEESQLAERLSRAARLEAESYDWRNVSEKWFAALDKFQTPVVR